MVSEADALLWREPVRHPSARAACSAAWWYRSTAAGY